MTNDKLTSDVYSIEEYVDNIKKEYTEGVDEDTLQLGIFGYLGEVNSNAIQNAITMASEFSNEAIPTRAKFEKNIIAHALGLGYTKINATPASIDVLLTFRRAELDSYLDSHATNLYYIDCDNKFYIGDYEFHLDYDMRIKRVIHIDGNINYTATYVTDVMDNIAIDGYRPYNNPISDITNPYIVPPTVINLGGDEVVYVKCSLHQCTKSYIDTEILQDNTIVSRSTSFSFTDQLAGFTIDAIAGDEVVHMLPVYEGLYTTLTTPYFYYTFLDSNTIRIKFTQSSYQPRVNAKVRVNLITTKGSEGNFQWNGDIYPYTVISSDKLFQEIDDNEQVIKTLQSSYSNIVAELRPITGKSQFGTDKKTIEELKQIIPRESIARGSISTLADLQNYFNSMDTESSRMFPYKRRDNCLERLYYGYILMKNSVGNIIPANTIDIDIYPDELSGDSIKKLFKYNTALSYSSTNRVANMYIQPLVGGVDMPTIEEDLAGRLYNNVVYSLENADDLCSYIEMSNVTHHYSDPTDTTSFIYHKATAVLDIDKYEDATVLDLYKDWILTYITEYCHKYFAFITPDTATVRLGLDGGYEIPLGANIKSILYSQFKEYLSYNDCSLNTLLSNIADNKLIIPVTVVGTHINSSTNVESNYKFRVEFGIIKSALDLPSNEVENFTELLQQADNQEIYLYANSSLKLPTKLSSIIKLTGANMVTLKSDLTIIEGDKIENQDDTTDEKFNYICPYNMVVNTKPFYMMYYLPYMNNIKDLNFDYVDESAEYQFIATKIEWKRLCLPEYDLDGNIVKDIDKYYADIPMQINMTNSDLIKINNNEVTYSLVRVFMILKKNSVYKRWIEGTIASYDDTTNTFYVHFEFSTQNPDNKKNTDIINDYNEIRIFDVNRLGCVDAEDARYGYGDFSAITSADIYICYYYDPEDDPLYVKPKDYDYMTTEEKIAAKPNAYRMRSNDNEDVSLIGVIDDYSLYTPVVITPDDITKPTKDYYLCISNKYSVSGGLNFFYDFSHICNSRVEVQEVDDPDNSNDYKYHISGVPVLKAGYFNTEERAQEFIDDILNRKSYIDSALNVIEDSFGIDLKFVNTYGPCDMTTLDNKNTYLDRVNLTLRFRLKYNANYDSGVIDNIKDAIKIYIEDINSISSIHMSNICSDIMDRFSESLEFFEFVSMNEYDANIQHMYAKDQTEAIKVPEFVNVETLDNDTPSIEIEVVS